MFLYFCLKSFWCLLCGRFLYNLKVCQSSASAPSRITRGCLEKHLITLDPMSWSIKEVSMQQTRQSDYRALTLSLSHRSLMVGLRYSRWYVRAYPNTVRLTYLTGRMVLRVIQKESRRFRWVIEWLTSSRCIMIVSFRLSLLRCSTRWIGNTITIVLPLLP